VKALLLFLDYVISECTFEIDLNGDFSYLSKVLALTEEESSFSTKVIVWLLSTNSLLALAKGETSLLNEALLSASLC
jgi:hypothetical protein